MVLSSSGQTTRRWNGTLSSRFGLFSVRCISLQFSQGERGACCYCIRKGLIRKSQFAFNMNKYISKNPDSVLAKAVPETFLFEVRHDLYSLC